MLGWYQKWKKAIVAIMFLLCFAWSMIVTKALANLIEKVIVLEQRINVLSKEQ